MITFSHAEPALAVRNVAETVAYWHEVLGFPGKWTWGDPPNHGGVSWHGAFVQFSLNPELAAVSSGHSVWIKVRELETLYALHQERKAEIVAPITNRPWGMAEYTVRDINGYCLNFSSTITDKKISSETLPQNIRIVARNPTASEYLHLTTAIGWTSSEDNLLKQSLATPVFAVVAEETALGEAIGCAFLYGDNVAFYYVKDVIVHPHWQHKRIGTAMMQEVTRWAETNAPDKATIGLFTGENLAGFYRQFGFIQACGMYRQINHDADNRTLK
jgi:GNAT superfamily N-acetyltransferase/uncharacterized glyoxalase superfamily protein PhnB